MLRLIFIILSVVGLYAVVHPTLHLAPLPAFPGNVNLSVQSTVSSEDKEAITRAICFTGDFWDKEYGLKLDQPVRVTIVLDQISYLQHLINEEHLPTSVAYFQTGHSAGLTHANHVVINARSAKDYNELIFITAHELSHQYQRQLNPSPTRLTWLVEGMADVIAARVVSENIGREDKAADYHQQWLSNLKAIRKHPRLNELDTSQGWLSSIVTYGETSTYHTAGVAVAALAKQAGYQSLGQLQKKLCLVDSEQAFKDLYGKSLTEFYEEVEQVLNQ